MPTEVVLTGVTCVLDADQDPEQWLCAWRGRPVAGGDAFVLATSSDAGEPVNDALQTELDHEDYELA